MSKHLNHNIKSQRYKIKGHKISIYLPTYLSILGYSIYLCILLFWFPAHQATLGFSSQGICFLVYSESTTHNSGCLLGTGGGMVGGWESRFFSLTKGWFLTQAMVKFLCQGWILHRACPYDFSSVQFSRSVMSDSWTPWTTAHQASLSITNSQSPPKPTSIESMICLKLNFNIS